MNVTSVNGVLYLEILDENFDKYKVLITNTKGQLICKKEINTSIDNKLELYNISKGLIIINIESSSRRKTVKTIII
jgi:sRNA-binding regulator protein Hfq